MINNSIIFSLFSAVGTLFGILLYVDSSNSFLTLLKLIFGSLFVLIFPGYFLLMNIFSKKDSLNYLELLAFSFVFSIVVIALIVMCMTIVKFPITILSLFVSVCLVSVLAITYYYLPKKHRK